MDTKPKTFCFVLMPFDEEFEDIYKLGIKESCIDAGAYCERVDEQIFSESILERIYNQISKADIVIADMTNRNPNVFYEVGYAHALGKQTILLTKNSSDIPFDLKHYPHIIYKNKISFLKQELTKRIKWSIENIESNNEQNQIIDINLYLNNDCLSKNGVTYISDSRYPNPTLTIHNESFKTFNPGDYSIGFITDDNFISVLYANEWAKTLTLPNGKKMHVIKYIDDILFPNSYTTISPQIWAKAITDFLGNTISYKNEKQTIIVRIYTSNGYRDFDLTIDFQQ